jgi:hypothetical protein
MITAQQEHVYREQPRRRVSHWWMWWGFWGSLLVAIGFSVALLFGIYARPLDNVQDIGTWNVAVSDLYSAEHNADFTYAYTAGDATLDLPQTGAGRFITELRIGTPRAQVPLAARLATPTQQIALGTFAGLRVYHVLLPTTARGDIQVHLQSTTMRISGDPRELGVLVDWVRVRSLGSFRPPTALLISIPALLLLLSLATSQLGLAYRWNGLLLLLSGAALVIACAVFRGILAIHPAWLIGGGLVAVGSSSLSRVIPNVDASLRRALPPLPMRLARLDWSRFAAALRCVVPLFAIWRVALWLICGLSVWFSSAIRPFAHAITTDGTVEIRDNLLRELGWKIFIRDWMQWDSHHYQGIALHGYNFYNQHWPNIAFFPLYPMLIRVLFPWTGGHTEAAAFLVANVAFFAALLLLYDLLSRDFDSTVARRTLVLLLVFPTSFFFGAGYSESLALGLTVAAVWAMRRQYWWLTGAAGFLLALTRLPGVFIAPVLAITYLQQHHWRWRTMTRPAFFAILLPPLGLALFMLFQWWRFDQPFAFLIAQRDWDNHISPPWVMPSMLLTHLQTAPDWEITLFQLVVWASFIGLTALAVYRLPLVYGLTTLLLVVPPYLSSWPRSLPRHVLIVFPLFVVMALLAERAWIRRLLIVAMLILLTIGTMLYVNAYWVA